MHPVLVAGITAELRAFVRHAGTRRALPTTCHVGRPGRETCSLPAGPALEPSLRADLVERAIDGLVGTEWACAWVTRGGDLELNDADLAWFSAARTAFARHGLVLPAFLVLNRSGWWDLVSEERRQWSRVRTR